MKNFHQTSRLVTEEVLERIQTTLEASWSRDTVDPENKNHWSVENKSLGQCAVTALVIHDMFGGRMIYDKANFHIWNEFSDGTQHDFTRSQFKDEKVFSIYKYKSREDILYDERGKATGIFERYTLLKQKMSAWK